MRLLVLAVSTLVITATNAGCETCEEYGPDGWHPAPCVDEDVISYRVQTVATETPSGPFVAWHGEDYDIRGGPLGQDDQLVDDELDGFAAFSIAADGDDVLIAGSAYRQGKENVLRVDHLGTGSSIVADTAPTNFARVIFDGDGFVVAYTRSGSSEPAAVRVVRIDRTGQLVGPPVVVTGLAETVPYLAADADGAVVGWSEEVETPLKDVVHVSHVLRLRRVMRDGTLGPVVTPSGGFAVGLGGGPAGLMVAWRAGDQILAGGLDAALAMPGDPMEIAVIADGAGQAIYAPAVAGDPSRFAVVWQTGDDYPGLWARVFDGALGPTFALGRADQYAVIAGPGRLDLIWVHEHGDRDTRWADLYAAELTRDAVVGRQKFD